MSPRAQFRTTFPGHALLTLGFRAVARGESLVLGHGEVTRSEAALSNFRRQVWYRAVAGAGLPNGLRIHDLRHACASLLIAHGAHPKATRVHLGHSLISVTMDRYGHLFL